MEIKAEGTPPFLPAPPTGKAIMNEQSQNPSGSVLTGLAMRKPLKRCHMLYSRLPHTLAKPALGVRYTHIRPKKQKYTSVSWLMAKK